MHCNVVRTDCLQYWFCTMLHSKAAALLSIINSEWWRWPPCV
jgi:hypothetical protein